MSVAASKPMKPVLSATRGRAPEVLVAEVDEPEDDEVAFVVELLTRLEQLTFEGTVALLNRVKSAHYNPICQQLNHVFEGKQSEITNLEESAVTAVVLYLDRDIRTIRKARDVQIRNVNRNARRALAACREERHCSGESLTRRSCIEV